jgi:hypothetical protein
MPLIGNELESGQSEERGPGWTPLSHELQCLYRLDLCLVTASGLPPISVNLPLCRGIFIAYMLQVSLLQKILENPDGTPNGCAQRVSAQ